jgi:hypothetical protein
MFEGAAEPPEIESSGKEIEDVPHDIGIEESPSEEELPAGEDPHDIEQETPVQASLTEPTPEEGVSRCELINTLVAVVEAPTELESTPEKDVIDVPQESVVQQQSSEEEPVTEEIHSPIVDETEPEHIPEEVAVESVPHEEGIFLKCILLIILLVVAPREASEDDVAPVHEAVPEETTPEDVVSNEPPVSEDVDENAPTEPLSEVPDQVAPVAQEHEEGPVADESMYPGHVPLTS